MVWFSAWSQEQRRYFFERMLGDTVPSPMDELSALLRGSMAIATEQPWDMATFDGQVHHAMAWFRSYDDGSRNVLLNRLEEIDMAAVYDFIDKYKQLRWK